jgi:hypothetical protein
VWLGIPAVHRTGLGRVDMYWKKAFGDRGVCACASVMRCDTGGGSDGSVGEEARSPSRGRVEDLGGERRDSRL